MRLDVRLRVDVRVDDFVDNLLNLRLLRRSGPNGESRRGILIGDPHDAAHIGTLRDLRENRDEALDLARRHHVDFEFVLILRIVRARFKFFQNLRDRFVFRLGSDDHEGAVVSRRRLDHWRDRMHRHKERIVYLRSAITLALVLHTVDLDDRLVCFFDFCRQTCERRGDFCVVGLRSDHKQLALARDELDRRVGRLLLERVDDLHIQFRRRVWSIRAGETAACTAHAPRRRPKRRAVGRADSVERVSLRNSVFGRIRPRLQLNEQAGDDVVDAGTRKVVHRVRLRII